MRKHMMLAALLVFGAGAWQWLCAATVGQNTVGSNTNYPDGGMLELDPVRSIFNTKNDVPDWSGWE